jgi:hypothetical protein
MAPPGTPQHPVLVETCRVVFLAKELQLVDVAKVSAAIVVVSYALGSSTTQSLPPSHSSSHSSFSSLHIAAVVVLHQHQHQQEHEQKPDRPRALLSFSPFLDS